MPDRKESIVALIPARAGSKRVVDKNIRRLAGHPLLAYTIAAAVQIKEKIGLAYDIGLKGMGDTLR